MYGTKKINQSNWTVAPDFRMASAFCVLDFLCITDTVIMRNHPTWVQGQKQSRNKWICSSYLFYLRFSFVRPLITLPAADPVKQSVARSNHFWHYWSQFKSLQTSQTIRADFHILMFFFPRIWKKNNQNKGCKDCSNTDGGLYSAANFHWLVDVTIKAKKLKRWWHLWTFKW